jgi:hypothetical protein
MKQTSKEKAQIANLRDYGGPGELCTRWSKTGYAPEQLWYYPDITNMAMQGYELADEEVRISLEDFKKQFTGGDGEPE